MPSYLFLWNDEIEAHLAEHDVAPQEFEEVVCRPGRQDMSRSTGRPVAFGYASTGRYLCCVYELLDETTVLPVTAYEVEE